MRNYNLLNFLLLAATTVLAHPFTPAAAKPDADTLSQPATLGPSLEEFLASSTSIDFDKRSSTRSNIKSRQSNSSSSSNITAGVEICTEPDFAGECVHSVWPINQCIDLKGYRGVTKSFLPDDGFECLLMQGQCDASDQYIEIGDSDQEAGGDLTKLDWIEDSMSYICFTEIASLQRFVHVARLRTLSKSSWTYSGACHE